MSRPLRAVSWICAALLCGACSNSSSSDGLTSNGGSGGFYQSYGTGGDSFAAGGLTSAGGSPDTGGSPDGSGGYNGSGGFGTGGAADAGETTGDLDGGLGTGGFSDTGGTTGAGGVSDTGGDTGSGGFSDTGGDTSTGGTTAADPKGPCKDLNLPCFDSFDMWELNPTACAACNAGKGCQMCVFPYAQ